MGGVVDYRNRESGRVAWLLTLHNAQSGRVYAGYGGIYVGTSLVWLALVDGVRPDRWDVFGIYGAGVIYSLRARPNEQNRQ